MRVHRSAVDIIQDAKRLALEYKLVTGKPLGIVGEIAEVEASRLLNLELALARTPGHDAVRRRASNVERIQIKGRAVDVIHPRLGRVPSLRLTSAFDAVILVLLDEATLEPFEIWEASREAVEALLTKPGSKARNERAAAGISQFCGIALRIWRSDLSHQIEQNKRERIARSGAPRPIEVAFTPERRSRWEQVTKNGPFNTWLRPQVSGPDGGLDLERLYAVARAWGISDRYDHLNAGMARMNIGNKLRGMVPVHVYSHSAGAGQVDDATDSTVGS